MQDAAAEIVQDRGADEGADDRPANLSKSPQGALPNDNANVFEYVWLVAVVTR